MTKLSLWISTLVSAACLTAAAQTSYPLLLDGQERAVWAFTLDRRELTMTGICIVRQGAEGVAGTVVNEFGVKAFDFTVRKGRLKLRNMAQPINRWYIRRTLRSDLRCLVAPQPRSVGRRRTLTLSLPDSIVLLNKRFDITYRFQRINIDTEQ